MKPTVRLLDPDESDAFTRTFRTAMVHPAPTPAQLEATGSWGSNVTLSWRRRTRVGGELIDGMGEVPLAEDSEQYDLEILDGPGGAVLRTEAGIATTSFTYTSGMQSADFGGVQTELSFVVYQISAQVGRGFPGERPVEILP